MNLNSAIVCDIIFKATFIIGGIYFIGDGVRDLILRKPSITQQNTRSTILFSIIMANILLYVSSDSRVKYPFINLEEISIISFGLLWLFISIVLFFFYKYLWKTDIPTIQTFGIDKGRLLKALCLILEKNQIEFKIVGQNTNQNIIAKHLYQTKDTFVLSKIKTKIKLLSTKFYYLSQIEIHSNTITESDQFVFKLIDLLNNHFKHHKYKINAIVPIFKICIGIICALSLYF